MYAKHAKGNFWQKITDECENLAENYFSRFGNPKR